MRCKAVRSTAYSQVVGPTIIHQINTANNLANFLSDIVSLLMEDYDLEVRYRSTLPPVRGRLSMV